MSIEQHLIRLSQGEGGVGPADLMRLCLFDWAVCAIAGRNEPVARVLRAQLSHDEQPNSASVVGGGRAPAPMAALINGAIGHALDYDDTHFDHIGHTSAVIFPTVLAMAGAASVQQTADLLEAAVVGSEAAVRVGLWLGRGHYQIGFHQTATAGAFGACVAAARMSGLAPALVRHAIGLAATGASGLKGQFGTMGKPLNAGLAARCGVEAALWAQAGMTSDAAGLSGLQGFGATHAGRADMAAWDMSEIWKIARISHKFHACCHGLHAMLEALAGITGEIDTVTVATHPRWLTVCHNPAPRTGLECKFSYAMTAAMCLSGVDTARIANFSDTMANDPALIALRDRVTVQDDDRLTEMQARVTARFSDGTTQEAFHDLNVPLPLAERAERLTQKARAVVGRALADDLWAAVQSGDIGDLTALLGRD